MIKITGAIFLILGTALLGISASSSVAMRARTLSGFASALDIMHSEIGERLTPLDELMKRLSETSAMPLNRFFENCAEEMERKRDIPFAIIWTKAIKHSEYLKLKPREMETISTLGNVLGRYSAKEQVVAIEHMARCIGSLSIDAEREKSSLGKLYAKLGVICGVAIVIVFI